METFDADVRHFTIADDGPLAGGRAPIAPPADVDIVLSDLGIADEAEELAARYARVRRRTEALMEPLSPADMVVQSMPDASPGKWHLAHTSWFFETLLLPVHLPGYQSLDAAYGYLFNSYYESLGPRQPRAHRGLLTRPTLREVVTYRRHVDEGMTKLLKSTITPEIAGLTRLGLAREEQHQELLLMDVLDLFSRSPIKPTYDSNWPLTCIGRRARFIPCAGGAFDLGAVGPDFVFDNECARHRTRLKPFEIGDRLVTNGEWLAFMADGGYIRPEL